MKFAYLGIFLAVSTLFIMPLSVPIFNHLVVVMTPDASVNRAADVMREEIPDAIVVEYGSLEYNLVAHRAYGGVTWISHGSEEYVEVGTQEMNWNNMASIVRTTPSRDTVLACHSGAIYNYIDNTEAIAFPGQIDSVMGALLASIVVTRSPETVQRFCSYAQNVMDGKQSVDSLESYVVGQLGLGEYGYWIAIAMLTFAAILFSYFSDMGFWTTLGYSLVGIGGSAILVTLVWLWRGWIDPVTAAAKIVGFVFGTMIGAMAAMLAGNIFAYAIFAACILATVAMYTASGGTLAAAKIILAITAGLAFLVGLGLDYFDSNTWVG
ncbi:MAG: hypothetical protein P1Q69_16835 [Candidatus Thorarchaeota archaeon]|nr:hypothetical protein [Candidatus Thorarchaeota archaeon]